MKIDSNKLDLYFRHWLKPIAWITQTSDGFKLIPSFEFIHCNTFQQIFRSSSKLLMKDNSDQKDLNPIVQIDTI